ncbi:MAG: hypothetical protein AAGH79_16545, partial [Bacteroidota bacterium]
EETNYLMDFVLYEKIGSSGSLIDQIDPNDHSFSSQEEMILEGMRNSYNSIFEITKINKSDSALFLNDLVSSKEFVLKDIGFSNTAAIGSLMYTRLIPILDINMTSGLSFVFHQEDKARVLTKALKKSSRRIRRNPKKRIYKETLLEKMIKCNALYGIPVFHLGRDDYDEDIF